MELRSVVESLAQFHAVPIWISHYGAQAPGTIGGQAKDLTAHSPNGGNGLCYGANPEAHNNTFRGRTSRQRIQLEK